jgi:orotate phosphoribosyltransferase
MNLPPILQKAVVHGDFKLACGERSEWLVDTSQVLRTREGQRLVNLMSNSIPFYYEAMGGPLSAADLMCPALGASEWFGVRKEAKGRGLDKYKLTGNLKAGQLVLMVEDVCTSGETLIRAAEEAAYHEGIPIGAVVLINRTKYGGVKRFEDRFGIPVHSFFTFEE